MDCIDLCKNTENCNYYTYFNTKSTDAQGILKPKSVIPREEGGLGFLIITKLNILNTEVCKINNNFYLAKEKYYNLNNFLF